MSQLTGSDTRFARSAIAGWTKPRERGMRRCHDLLDWVGGYPFEVAKPEEVFLFCRGRGFEVDGEPRHAQHRWPNSCTRFKRRLR